MSEAMLEVARTWRGLDKLVVTVRLADEHRDEDVKLGIPRGRWRRVAQQLGSMEVAAARGYQKGELIGTWEAQPEAQPDVDDDNETPAQASHRQHTKWCFEEARKGYESQQRLTIELVTVVVEIVRTFRPAPQLQAQPAPVEDQAAQTLQMLLGAAMMNQNQKGNDDEEIRTAGRENGGVAGQGSAGESGNPGA